MTERPILFSAPMFRAILDGQKTQTRRVVKPQPAPHESWDWSWPILRPGVTPGTRICWRDDVRTPNLFPYCPYGRPGDRLWVRETWTEHERLSDVSRIVYAASRDQSWSEMHRDVPVAQAVTKYAPRPMQLGWRPSIHMPRWASRILLEIVSVRVERLQDCSREDALAEGALEPSLGQWVDVGFGQVPRANCAPETAYAALWDLINGEGSWSANPWVWVVEFKRVSP